MNDTEYHAKIKRLPIGEIPKTRKPLMSESEMTDLLTGDVIIEEKLDGKLLRHRSQGWDIFTEDLRIRHSVYYDRLPSFLIILDAAEGDQILQPENRRFLGTTPPQVDIVNTAIGNGRLRNMTPETFMARLPGYLNRTSTFSTASQIEGIVVKNYDKQLFGKVVNIEFYRGIEASGSYLKRRVPQRNRLAPKNLCYDLWTGLAQPDSLHQFSLEHHQIKKFGQTVGLMTREELKKVKLCPNCHGHGCDRCQKAGWIKA